MLNFSNEHHSTENSGNKIECNGIFREEISKFWVCLGWLSSFSGIQGVSHLEIWLETCKCNQPQKVVRFVVGNFRKFKRTFDRMESTPRVQWKNLALEQIPTFHKVNHECKMEVVREVKAHEMIHLFTVEL